MQKFFFLILRVKAGVLFNSNGVKWSELEDEHFHIVSRLSMHTAISVPSPVCHHCMVFNPLNTHHHISVMELGHLLTRSGLTYSEISSKVCHNSFCQLGNRFHLNALNTLGFKLLLLPGTEGI